MNIKIKCLLLIVILYCNSLSQEQYHKFFFQVTNNYELVLIEDVTPDNLLNCLVWYDYWNSYGESGHINVEIDAGALLPGITTEQFQSATHAAITAWNSIVKKSSTTMFAETTDHPYSTSVHIVPLVDWNEKGYYLYEMGAPEFAIIVTEDAYVFTYYNASYANQPGDEYSIIFLNADPETSPDYFTWCMQTNPPSGYEDLQHIIMHELGHILGFADDIDPNDGLNTIMSQGSHWSRTVEQALRNSFEALYEIDTTSPLLNDDKHNGGE